MDQRDVVDALLELAVVPSFSAIGARVRRPLWGWEDPGPGSLSGRTVVVTGATGGLGRAASHALANLGARVVLVGRSREKLDALRDELTQSSGEDRFPVVVADLAGIEAARAAGREIAAANAVVDVVVDNAGMIYPERTLSPEGHEASMALMVLAPFAFVTELLPALRRSPDGRVVVVTSGGMYAQALDAGDLDGAAVPYNGARFYARAKRAQVSLVREWARRTRGSTLSFVSMHPGWARTPGLAASLPGFEQVMGPILRTPEEGIDTITWLASAPPSALEPGRLYLDRRPRPFDRVPWTRMSAAQRRALWDEVVRRTGGEDPAAPVSDGPSPTGAANG